MYEQTQSNYSVDSTVCYIGWARKTRQTYDGPRPSLYVVTYTILALKTTSRIVE